MSARRERVVATGRTNSARGELGSARPRTTLPSARRPSPLHAQSAAAGPGVDVVVSSLPSVEAAGPGLERAATAAGAGGAGSRAGSADHHRPQTAFAGAGPETPGHSGGRGQSTTRPQTTTGPSTSRFGNLPNNFWDVQTEKWIEHYRDERIKNPHRFVPEAMRFTKPQVSKVLPLRSLLLDPSANTMPQAKTQTEFLRNIRERNFAHPTYDIDGDGVIDHDDMRQAKKFDVDGIGFLRPEEEAVGKRLLAERFFHNHKDQLHLFNQAYTKKSEKDNVKDLVTSHAFTEIYNKVKLHDQCLRNRASKQMISCMALPNQEICKWNYYTEKADATAWCDWGGMPRKVMYPNYTDHSGSREKLMQCRRISMRDYCSQRLDARPDPMAEFSTKRIDLITNFAKWSA